jgi:hypothetical protein
MRFFCMLIFSVYKSIDKTQPFTILKVAVLFEIKRILYIRAVVLPILALTEKFSVKISVCRTLANTKIKSFSDLRAEPNTSLKH